MINYSDIKDTTGFIFNIQRFSIHDGPGARTAVFFKGCNLHCKWCHNPESIEIKPSLEFYPQKCIGCGACFSACPSSAHMLISIGENDLSTAKHIIDRAHCTRCLACVDTCYAKALVGVGREVTAEYVVDAVKSDMPYYEKSGGGVTVSGGECMIQPEFLLALLTGCRESGIHTAVDTAGFVPWEFFEKIIPVTDLFLYDIKAASSDIHRELTGVGNERIIENLNNLCSRGCRVIVRIPYIGGFNDGEIEGIANILAGICDQEGKSAIELVEILAYHKLGNSKYEALDLENPVADAVIPTDEEIDSVVDMLRAKGLNARKS